MHEPTHIFISPHLDDAILSCGATIAVLVENGVAVTILTLFTGVPELPYSPLATKLHAMWGNPPNLVARRKVEDINAAAHLGARVIHANLLDGIYRRDQEGNHLYGEIADLFQGRHHDDDPLVAHIASAVRKQYPTKPAVYHFPLGIGLHVDHVAAFDAAPLLSTQGYDVLFYEDLPYAAMLKLAHQRSPVFQGWRSIDHPLEERHLAAKLNACTHYHSQIPFLFGSESLMRACLTKQACLTAGGETCYAERSWQPR